MIELEVERFKASISTADISDEGAKLKNYCRKKKIFCNLMESTDTYNALLGSLLFSLAYVSMLDTLVVLVTNFNL